jgi:hypothetical protein
LGLNISVRRKRDDVYLKLMGNFSNTSAYELLGVLKKVVMASLQFSSPGSAVLFTFKTQAKVNFPVGHDLDKARALPGRKTPRHNGAVI